MLEINKIHHMDCLKGLKQIPDNSIDLVLTDPPYNINFESNHGKNFKVDWDTNFVFNKYFNELWRVLKNDSLLIVFSRHDTYADYMKRGIPIPTSMLIWNKKDYSMGDLKWFSTSYEIILIWKKGNPKLNSIKRPNGMLNFYKVQNSGAEEFKKGEFVNAHIHPTQKPIRLIRYLTKICSNENSLILDPFMGSGTTAVACKQLNRNFIGFELSQEYVDIANKRLAQENLKGWFDNGKD